LGECGFAIPDGLAEAGWRGTPPLTRSRRRLAHHRLFVVGDSAGYVEPFTGEGVSWAIQAAVLLSSHVLDALERWRDEMPATWEIRYRRFFRIRKRTCVLASALLRHHLLARATVTLLGRAHRLASPWVRTISSLDSEVQAIAERLAR
jgi:flavin-dependent dehydrogenase